MSAERHPGARCGFTPLVDRHFAGGNTPADERGLREHLPGCEPCRTRYERQLLLASLTGKGLPRGERLARGLGLEGEGADGASLLPRFFPGDRARPWWRSPLAAGALSLALVAAALLVAPGIRHRTSGPADLAADSAKVGAAQVGSAAAPAGGDPLPLLHFDRAPATDPGQTPPAPPIRYTIPASAPGQVALDPPLRLRPTEPLVVAYENPRGPRHLLILVQDRRGGLWYLYPPAGTGGEAPAPLPVAASAGSAVALAPAVVPALRPGPARLIGVFLQRPELAAGVMSRLRDGLPPLTSAQGEVVEAEVVIEPDPER